MDTIQLEFNIENKSPEELRLFLMEKQIQEMNDSMGKVRRKLFSEMGEMKKLFYELQKETYELKMMLKEIKNEKIEWTYGQNDCLFDVQEYRKAMC